MKMRWGRIGGILLFGWECGMIIGETKTNVVNKYEKRISN
jgi:hypothetical protein